MSNPASPLAAELRPDRLVPGLTAGLLMGLVEVILAMSLGSLIFSGDLAAYRADGIGLALMAGGLILLMVALAGGVPAAIGSVQDSPSVLLSVMAAALAASLAGSERLLPTLLAAIALSALATGLLLLALGIFRLGALVRYIPYPVVGGFLAGTGWLLAVGSIGTMSDLPLTLANLPALLQPDQLIQWLPGVVIALALLFGLRLIRHTLAMPGLLVGLIALFYLGLLLTGTTIPAATERGLLIGAVGEVRWQPLTLNPALLGGVDWAALAGQIGSIGVLMALTLVSVLLNATGLELAIGEDVDLNRELRATGLANLLSGLAGGLVGYHALSLSALSHRIGGRGRLPGVVAGLLCLTLLLAGADLLAYVPRSLVGGMLLFLGLDFLNEWVVGGWRRFSKAEYGIVLLILIMIAAAGFLIGVAVGLVAMVILFAVNYSRIDAVHHELSGAQVRSSVERNPAYRRALAQFGPQIHVLERRGFLFFGTASALLDRIRARLDAPDLPPARFVIVDFRHVTGLDSSAALAFDKARQLLAARGVVLVLAGTAADARRRLGLDTLAADETAIQLLPDLDRGLEWCEDRVLEREGVTTIRAAGTLVSQLVEDGLDKDHAGRVLDYLDKITFEEGTYLIRQGDPADDMYFVELGQVSVYLEVESGERLRARTLGMGTAVGEVGLYLEPVRTASVIADAPTIAYRLTREKLAAMQRDDPALAAAFHQYVARLLAERLALTNRSLEALNQ